jgi:hypothetical protein
MRRRPVIAKKKYIGSFDAGTRNVEVYACAEDEAHFHMQPSTKKQATIMVGINPAWPIVMGNFLHEILEFTYADMGLRFVPAPDVSRDNGNYFFSMYHTPFSEAAARAGLFLSEAVPSLQQYWKKVHKS